MKLSKTFRLSQEAVAELDKQTNATQYLEELILATGERTMQVVPLHQLEALLEPLLEEPKPQLQEPHNSSVSIQNIPNVTTGAEFVPKPPDPEFGYPCCRGINPCKHWLWDDSDTIWRNSLTGKERDA